MDTSQHDHVRRQAFWLSYSPAEQESIRDVDLLIRRSITGDLGACLSEVTREGRRVVDAILFTPKRQRVTTVCNPVQWKRKGAQGELVDARWPEAEQPVEAFLLNWAEAISCRTKTLGSEKQVFDAYDAHRTRERGRLRGFRKSKQGGRHVRPEDSLPSTRRRRRENRQASVVDGNRVSDVPVVPVGSGGAEAPVLVDGVSDSLLWSPHHFVDIDFEFDVSCWSSLRAEGFVCLSPLSVFGLYANSCVFR